MHGQPHSLEKVSEQDSDEDSGAEAAPQQRRSKGGKIKEIGQFSKEVDQMQESKYMKQQQINQQQLQSQSNITLDPDNSNITMQQKQERRSKKKK